MSGSCELTGMTKPTEVSVFQVGGAIQNMMRAGPLGFFFGKEEVHDDI